MYLTPQRWYNKVVEKFVVRDPVKEGTNLYGYARGNLLISIDPEGAFCWHIFGTCIGTTCEGDPRCHKNSGRFTEELILTIRNEEWLSGVMNDCVLCCQSIAAAVGALPAWCNAGCSELLR